MRPLSAVLQLVQGLMQRGPMDHLFNLQGAVYGDW